MNLIRSRSLFQLIANTHTLTVISSIVLHKSMPKMRFGVVYNKTKFPLTHFASLKVKEDTATVTVKTHLFTEGHARVWCRCQQ